ncbi:MAG: alpha/beta hydrolase [Blastocatellia bacterium]
MKKKLLLGFTVTLLGLFTLIWFAGSFLSKPVNHPVGALPDGLIGSEVEFASASGATIRGWLIPGRKGAGAVALMHGYRGDRTQVAGRAPFLNQAGYTVLAFDFQAHGESAGKYITVGYLESYDARAAVEFLKQRAPGEKIGVIGLSMGGVASILASPPLDVDAMVLELVYPDIRGATANRLELHLGGWARPLATLLTMQFPLRAGIDADALRPVDRIGAINRPKLFIAGAKDQHTKLAESKALFEAASEPKELWVVDAAHVNIHEAAKGEYEWRVTAFFNGNLKQ